MKSGGMKYEMTLFHTMGPQINVLFQTHLFCDHIWSRVELFSKTFEMTLVHLKIPYYSAAHFI